MKILPVIICGGAGTRLFPESRDNLPKQFIDFGNWNMFQKTLERINSSIYLPPIISTNIKYLSLVKKYLKKYQVKKYNIVLEPVKKNTAPAILATALLANIKSSQPMIFLPSDQLIENKIKFLYISSKICHLINSPLFSKFKHQKPKNLAQIEKLNEFVRLKTRSLSVISKKK